MTIGCSRLGRIEANRGTACPVGGYLRTQTRKNRIQQQYCSIVQHPGEHNTRRAVVRSLHYPLTISRVTVRATCDVSRATTVPRQPTVSPEPCCARPAIWPLRRAAGSGSVQRQPTPIRRAPLFTSRPAPCRARPGAVVPLPTSPRHCRGGAAAAPPPPPHHHHRSPPPRSG